MDCCVRRSRQFPPKPQTTRVNQLGILTTEEAQVIFIDTPGLHEPRHRLGEGMNAEAVLALQDADVVLWLVDAGQPPHEEDQLITARLAELAELPDVIQVLNKIDLVNDEVLSKREEEFAVLFPNVTQIAVSALTKEGVSEMLAQVIERLPEGEPLYPLDQVTDQYEREIAADLIREAALQHLHEEVPMRWQCAWTNIRKGKAVAPILPRPCLWKRIHRKVL